MFGLLTDMYIADNIGVKFVDGLGFAAAAADDATLPWGCAPLLVNVFMTGFACSGFNTIWMRQERSRFRRNKDDEV